jgi:hypothetical protein
MTIERDEHNLSAAEAEAFLESLGSWAAGLAPGEREFLATILLRAARSEAADAEGFLMKAQPYIPELRPVPSPESSTSIVSPTGGGFLLGQLQTYDLTPLMEGSRTFGGL